MSQSQPQQHIKIKGYIYVLIENFNLQGVQKEVSCKLSMGANAQCQTKAYPSGPVNEVFLIEVPEGPSARLVAQFRAEEDMIGECRFGIDPFFEHAGATHSMSSEITDNDQKKKGTVNIKLTYYSAQHGKLKIRIFHLSLLDPIVEYYKQAKLKLKIGIFAQSSEPWDMSKEFDQTMELLVLTKNANLEFNVVNEEGILAQYTINDLEKSNLLIDQTKAYQVSLFNKDKAVGTIKYQVDWIH